MQPSVSHFAVGLDAVAIAHKLLVGRRQTRRPSGGLRDQQAVERSTEVPRHPVDVKCAGRGLATQTSRSPVQTASGWGWRPDRIGRATQGPCEKPQTAGSVRRQARKPLGHSGDPTPSTRGVRSDRQQRAFQKRAACSHDDATVQPVSPSKAGTSGVRRERCRGGLAIQRRPRRRHAVSSCVFRSHLSCTVFLSREFPATCCARRNGARAVFLIQELTDRSEPLWGAI